MKKLHLAALVVFASLPAAAAAGEVVTGNIFVCRKPMLAGQVAALRLMEPGPDAMRKLQEFTEEQNENCRYVRSVEITDDSGAHVPAGNGAWCKEASGVADGEEVFVQFGSVKKTWGSCP
jgi:hypothetical protein